MTLLENRKMYCHTEKSCVKEACLNPAFPKHGWPWNPFNPQFLLTLGEGFQGAYFREYQAMFIYSFTNTHSLDLPKFQNSFSPPQSVHLSGGDTCEVVYKKANKARARPGTHVLLPNLAQGQPQVSSARQKKKKKSLIDALRNIFIIMLRVPIIAVMLHAPSSHCYAD